MSSFVEEARNRVSRLGLPAGMYIQFAGTAEAQAQSRRDLLFKSLLAGLVTSTALNLLVLPAMALRHGRFVQVSAEE